MAKPNLRLIHERLAQPENTQDRSAETEQWVSAGPDLMVEIIDSIGNEQLSQNQIKSINSVKMRIRYTDRLIPSHRLRAKDGRIWNIESIQPEGQKRHWMMVRATEWQLSTS